ncbi:CHAT domain-containing protein [Nocardioides sp.]|uniref:CHAT domain-containing protein n=1 Tax=Nocardioides sp. TaxID=35761 RepID=UPI002632E0F7|nr:CHAT domain-containing protein [Nocardioides sp.]MCW2738587.1 Tetratricopeptide 4 [Nocardioides sp.]
MVTRVDAEDVLRTLFADPRAARIRAQDELVPDLDPVVSSIGHQVIGIVLRDLGETEEALDHLRTALRQARGVKDAGRVADVQATLGATLALSGRTRQGLRQLDAAASVLEGVPLGTVLVRRAWVSIVLLNRYAESLTDLRRAREVFVGHKEVEWEARVLNLEGYARGALGDLSGAERAFVSATELHEQLGHRGDVAVTVMNIGWLAFLGGDLPRTFDLFADSAARFDAVGVISSELVVDRCHAYLAAGLADDAWQLVSTTLRARQLQPRERADVLVAAAEAALAAGDPELAMVSADDASRLLRRQGRDQRRLRAEMLAIAARADARLAPGPLVARSRRLIQAAREMQAPELVQSLVLGARVAGSSRSSDASALRDSWLHEASLYRNDRSSLTSVVGWLALARGRDLHADSAGVLRACDRGLAALDDHRTTLGSQELMAFSSGHGKELAELGTRTALASGDSRRLLWWSERWRASALAVPPAIQEHSPDIAADLAALRAQHRRLAEARAEGAPTERLQARVLRLEQSVRQRLFHTRGTGARATSFDVGELLAALAEDDTVLVELVEVDGELHALVAGRGRVRRLRVGSAADATKAVDFALFALRQAARGRRAQLDLAGARLQRALLGSALDHTGDDRVVVSGTSALQGVPWGLMPGLVERPVTSTPSARLWLRARSARPADDDRRVMLVGPGLGSGGAEVPAVAAQDPGAEVLDGDDATVAAALAALDGAALAHVAAHGHFREDSPLFSSLTLADGPLLVHDLQRLRRPPHRVVLSACESGVMAPVGDQELLGLAAALLSMGTAGVVSSLAEVDDAATVEVMVALHASLRAGGGLGDALLAARSLAAGDPVLTATAASFTVLGI